jgi:hypothetical protein
MKSPIGFGIEPLTESAQTHGNQGQPKPLQVIDDKRGSGAGNEARTRDLNLGKVAPQIVQNSD